MTNPADIEYLNKLVARVNTLREHAVVARRTSIASLHTPNFVLVAEPVFADLDIPHPYSFLPPPQKLSPGRIVAGSIGAMISIGCFMLAMVQT